MGKISREKFIRLGTALGVGAATASLAACGGGSGGSGGDSGNSNANGNSAASSPSGAASSPSGSGGETTVSGGGENSGGSSGGGSGSNADAIAQASEVSPGSAVEFQDGGQPAVLVHLDSGDFVAYSAVCTHAQCTVAYRNGQLACPCHGSVFDPANGAEVVTGPAPTPLQEIPVSVEGGSVVRG